VHGRLREQAGDDRQPGRGGDGERRVGQLLDGAEAALRHELERHTSDPDVAGGQQLTGGRGAVEDEDRRRRRRCGPDGVHDDRARAREERRGDGYARAPQQQPQDDQGPRVRRQR
jgi:hypothetical protein